MKSRVAVHPAQAGCCSGSSQSASRRRRNIFGESMNRRAEIRSAACTWSARRAAISGVRRDRHQLVYLMSGKGTITLDGKSYDVAKGAGIYLGPAETATIAANQGAELKLFHLMVRKAQT